MHIAQKKSEKFVSFDFFVVSRNFAKFTIGGKSTIYEITEKQKEAESVMKNVFGFELTDYTKKLCEYLCGMTYEKIPDEVLERAKMLTLHAIGVALAAKELPQAKRAEHAARYNNGGTGGTATVWTTGEKLSTTSACYVNSTTADILDWEDCAWTGHPTACVIPTAVAMAEELHRSGRELLTAIVSAYEGYVRVAMSSMPPDDWDHKKGWGIVSFQNMAAAFAAAKLMGFDEQQMNQAIGITCINTPIISSFTQACMSNSYHYQNGQSSQTAIMGCINVRDGFDNLYDGLDMPYAYTEFLTVEPKREWITKDLDKFLMMKILVKHWPANMWIQTPIELVHDMARDHGIDPDEIAEILVDPPTQYRMRFNEEGFTSLMDAQFSMPFVLSSMLYSDRVGACWYDEKRFKDPKIIALAKKVKAGPSPEHTLNASFTMYQHGTFPRKYVRITMNDGTVYERTMAEHKGHPDNMLSREEFCEIFRNNAVPALGAEKAEKLMNFILDLENAEDIAAIGECF